MSNTNTMNEHQQKIDEILASGKYPIKWFDASKIFNKPCKAAYVNGMPIGVVFKKHGVESDVYEAHPYFPVTQDVLTPILLCAAFDFKSAQYYIGFHFVQFMENMNHTPKIILHEGA